MIPTHRLWVTACVLSLPAIAAGFVPGLWSLILLLDLALLSLAAVDFLIARRAPLKVWRVLPNRLQVGVANKIEIEAVNAGGRPLLLQIKDDVAPEFTIEPQSLNLQVSAQSRARMPYRATPGKRGKFEFGDLYVRTRGPLGFMWHERVFPARTPVSVFPDMRGASRLPNKPFTRRHQAASGST